MSPEQAAASGDVDHRTDVWSICVVLYEAIAGETPFNGPNATLLLLRAIVEDEPVSLAARGVADEPLWNIVRTGLSKDRCGRQASMSELGRELARWLLARDVHEDVCGTSLESKWLASDDAAVAAAFDAFDEAASSGRSTPDPLRTLPPRSARRSSARTAARTRSLRAAKVCTLLGALGLGFFAVTPKNKTGTMVVVSRAETAVQRGAGEALAKPATSHDGARRDDATPGIGPALSFAETAPAENVPPRPKPIVEQEIVNGRPRGQLGRPGVPLHKPQPTASRAALDLIAPY
jgi:hypothetical protein